VSKYLIEIKCSKCNETKYIESDNVNAVILENQKELQHLDHRPGCGYWYCGKFEVIKTWQPHIPDFPMSGVESAQEKGKEMVDDKAKNAFFVMSEVTRCPVCEMPLSRPLSPQSHLPDCWFREDLEKCTIAGVKLGLRTANKKIDEVCIRKGIPDLGTLILTAQVEIEALAKDPNLGVNLEEEQQNV